MPFPLWQIETYKSRIERHGYSIHVYEWHMEEAENFIYFKEIENLLHSGADIPFS